MSLELLCSRSSSLLRGDDIMVYDDSLSPGQNKTVRKGRDGKKSTTYIQYVKDGKVIEEKVLFTTTYPAIRAIVNYGPEVVYEDPTPPPTEPVIPPEEDNVWE